MTISVNYATNNAPVTSVKVANPQGYLDLIVNKTANGKGIKINARDGSKSVNIGLSQVDDLIEALKLVKDKGVATSVNALPFTF